MSTALEHAWTRQRLWSQAAGKKRSELDCWRNRVLRLVVFGAVSATLSAELLDWGVQEETARWLTRCLGILAAIVLALAAYFRTRKVTSQNQKLWVRARSASEAIKKEMYLHRASGPGYEGNQKDRLLLDRVTSIESKVRDIMGLLATIGTPKGTPPGGFLDIESYIKERVKDQVNGFYRPRAVEYGERIGRYRRIEFVLAGVAVVLGVLGTTALAGLSTAWVAVVTSLATAFAVHAAVSRFEYQVMSYTATAHRLEDLAARFDADQKVEGADDDRRRQFIRDCEDAISSENKEWMTELQDVVKPTSQTANAPGSSIGQG
jgi:ABC-type multidrug transport system fused ATPase/permease subunit